MSIRQLRHKKGLVHGGFPKSISILLGVSFVLVALIFLANFFVLPTQNALAQEGPLGSQNEMAEDFAPIEFAPDRLIVKVAPGVTLTGGEVAAASVQSEAGSLSHLVQTFGVTSVQELSVAGGEVSAASATANGSTATRATGVLDDVYLLGLPSGVDVKAAAQAFSADVAVVYAEPDYIARGVATPNDPDFPLQWGLSKIGAPAAWDQTSGSGNIIIAVVDSGIDTSHEEFQGRIWQNADPQDSMDNEGNRFIDDTNGWNFVSNSRSIADTVGHGTQVAAIIGAATNNGKGIAGLCAQCRIMPVVAMNSSGAANYSDIARAVEYASSNNARVINLSLGGYADSQLLRDAIAEASTHALIIAGAGNDDLTAPFYPAAYPQVIAVGGTGQDDKKWVGSNYGSWVDLVAPAEAIRTATLGSNGYVTTDGTSLSSGLVSGAAGLLYSKYETWTPEQVRWHLLNTVVNVNSLNPDYVGRLGSGRVSAQGALTAAPKARMLATGYAIDGVANDRPAPGQAFDLAVTLRNVWMPAPALNATLSSTNPNVTISNATVPIAAIPSGTTSSTGSNPFRVTLVGGTPYNSFLDFILTFTGSGYSTTVPLRVQVRSSVVELGDTNFTTASVGGEVVWTADHTYVLNGSVIVGPGVTLRIEPGTEIRVAPQKFIRVDGALVANGTDALPIAFTPKAEGQGHWSGIRFTEGSIGSTLDGNGAYQSGSILNHCVMQGAATALSINGSASAITPNPGFLISNCAFDGNETGIIAINRSFNVLNNSFSGCNQAAAASNSSNPFNAAIFKGNQVVCPTWGPFEIRNYRIVDFQNNRIDGFGEISLFLGSGWTDPTLTSEIRVSHNSFKNMTGGLGVVGDGSGTVSITHNTFANNDRSFYSGIQSNDTALTVANNNFVGSRGTDLELGAGTNGLTVNASNNYWSVPSTEVQSRIKDCTFDVNGCGAGATLGTVLFSPVLSAPDATAPAFITDIAVSPEPVGLQRGTVNIDFSRPMQTSLPLTVTAHDARRGTMETKWRGEDNNDAHVEAGTRDAQGRMWFSIGSAANYGLRIWDGQQWSADNSKPFGDAKVFYSLHGGSDGRVWAAPQEGGIAVKSGSNWMLMPTVEPPLYANLIEEDREGRILVLSSSYGDTGGLVTWTGSSWQKLAPPLPDSVYGEHLGVDALGQFWIRGYGGQLYLLQNGAWSDLKTQLRKYSDSPLSGMLSDQQGRIWIVFQTGIVVRITAGVWEVVDIQDNLGGIASITESPDGTLWLVGWSQKIGRIDPAGNVEVMDQADTWMGTWGIAADRFSNLWMKANATHGQDIRVFYYGLDYPITGGEWVSPTRWRGYLDVTREIPQGSYVLDVTGAVGADGLPAVLVTDTFQIAYAGAVTTLPPAPPAVSARATGSLNTAEAFWSPVGTDKITQYRYAIGTTPNARDTVGWTYLTATSITRDRLNLVAGRTYYIVVQARSSSGLWSSSGISSFAAGAITTPPGTTATPLPGSTPTPTPVPGTTVTPLPGTTPTPTLDPGIPPSGDSFRIFLPSVRK